MRNVLTRPATCPNDKGLPTTSYSVDFTSLKELPSEWVLADATKVNLGASGAELTFAKRFDAPTMHTDFNFFFGRVEYVVKAAPGTGIVSSMVLLSDDLDEIDWEFRGSKTETVQTNYFGKGYTGTYNRSTENAVATPQEKFHTYALDWSKEALVWSIDGQVIRTLKAADADGNGSQYPQTPMRVSLSLWDGGDKDADPSTVNWAGGYTPLPPPQPYTMYIKSVKIWNANPAQQYQYTDKSGSWKSIKVINETMVSSSSSATYATQTLSLAPVAPTSVNSTLPVIYNATAASATKPAAWTASVYNTTYGNNSSMLHSTYCSESTTRSSNLSITAAVPSSFVTAIRTAQLTTAQTTPVIPKSGSISSPVAYTSAVPTSSVSVQAVNATSGVAAMASAQSTSCSEDSNDASTPTAAVMSSSYATPSSLPASASSAVSSTYSTIQSIAAVTTPLAVATPVPYVQSTPSSSLSVPVSPALSAVLSTAAPQVPVTSIQSIQAGTVAAVASTSSDCSDDIELMVPYTASETSTVSVVNSPSVPVTTSLATSAVAVPSSSYVASVPTSSAPAAVSSSYAVSTPVSVAASSAPSSYAVSPPASSPVSTPQSYVASTPASTPVSAPSSYVGVPPSSVYSAPSKQVLAAPAPSSSTVAQDVLPTSASSSSAVAQAVIPTSSSDEECSLVTVTVSASVVTTTVTYTASTLATSVAPSSAAPSPSETPAKVEEAVVPVDSDDDTTTRISSTTTHTRTLTSTMVSAGTGTGTAAYPYATGTGMPFPYVNGTRKEVNTGAFRPSGTGHHKPTAIPFTGAGSKMEIGWVMMGVAGVVAGLQML